MVPIEPDTRSAARRAQDEQIAEEPLLSPAALPPGAVPISVDAHLPRAGRHPLAIQGVVENGMIRLISPGVILPERSRVIVVAEGG